MAELARTQTSGGLTVKLVSEMTGYSPAQIALVARTVAVGATLQEIAVFLHSSSALGLDPLIRQCYWIRRKQADGSMRGTLQVGIDGFRAIAEKSGLYAGAESIEFRGTIEWGYKGATFVVPELARATVWKIVGGRKNAFVGEAYWSEFVPSQDKDAFMWHKMPRHMLGKVAEAQALRRAFPAQLGSLQMADDLDDAQPTNEVSQVDDADARRKRNAQRYDEIFVDDEPSAERALPAQVEPDEEAEDDDGID